MKGTVKLILLLLLIFTIDECIAKTVKSSNLPVNEAYDTTRIKVWNDLAFKYVKSDPEKGVQLAKKAIDLAGDLEHESNLAYSYELVGLNYGAMQKYPEALQYQLKALELYKAADQQKNAAAVLMNVSSIYELMLELDKAIKYGTEALQLARENKLTDLIPKYLENVGELYFEKSSFKKAEQFYSEAYVLYSVAKNNAALARVQQVRGRIMFHLKNYEESITLYKYSLSLSRRHGLHPLTRTNVLYLGDAYLSLKNYDMAMSYYNNGMRMNAAISDHSAMADVNGKIGICYLRRVEDQIEEAGELLSINQHTLLNQAKDYLLKAINYFEKNKMNASLAIYAKELSTAYRLSGFDKQALDMYILYESNRDSMISQEGRFLVSNLIADYELRLKDHKILLKNQELLTKKLDLAKKRNSIYLFALIAFLMLGLFFFIYIKFQESRESYHSLFAENQSQLQKLEKQMDDLTKHSTVLKEISYIQAHHVRGPVTTLLSMAKLFNYEDLSDPTNKFIIENMESVTKKLDDSVQSVIKMGDKVRRKSKAKVPS